MRRSLHFVPGGNEKMIAKALTLNAKLLILDEPTAALGGEETERLFAQIDQLRKQGVSFIYISHRLEEIARIADRVAVLRDGRLVATHPTAQVPVNVLLENMVGRSVDRIFPKIEKPEEKEVLKVEGLTSPDGSFTDVSFTVHAGEIFGIAGIVGAGRTELVRAITGADPISSGSIEIDGRPVHFRSPREALAAGIGMVHQELSVVPDLTVAENVYLGQQPTKGGIVAALRASISRARNASRSPEASAWITGCSGI